MRLAHLFLVLATLQLAWLGAQAGAQTQGRVVQRQAQPESPARFRARAAIERLATARNVAGDPRLNVSGVYLNTPFSLTPRQPNVDTRGWLTAAGVTEWWPRIPDQFAQRPWAGPDGMMQFGDSFSHARIHLENTAGARFLVDCTVFGAPQMTAETASLTAQVNASNVALLSIVTAPGENLVTIRTTPGSTAPWRLLGCEITRIQ